MKKLFYILAFLMATSAWAQQVNPPAQVVPQGGVPDCQIGPITATTTGRGQPYDNRFTGCTSWTLYEYGNGNVSTISIEIDEAPDTGGTPGSWTVWPVAAVGSQSTIPLTTVTAKKASVYTFFPWISVNLTTLTGAGANVSYEVLGYRPKSGTELTNSGTQASGVQSTQSSVTPAQAETSSTSNVSTFPDSTGNQNPLAVENFGVDPCQSSGVPKSSVSISITTATTTQIVAASGSTIVYVCGYNIVSNSTATTNTVQFEYGTGGTCGTGTAVLSGPMANGVTAVSFNIAGGNTLFKTTASQGLCIVSTVGTGPSIAGFVTFVQQ